MSKSGLVEPGLGFGSLLGFLVWELVSLRREQQREREKKRR